jgi:hypothetical protein
MITPALASAAIDCLDEVAVAMECKWGVGRLPKLVAPDLAAKFHAQADKLDAALSMKMHDAIVAHASAMERAWKALDKAASTAGALPMSPVIWQAIIPSTGEVVAIVRSVDEAAAVKAERWGTVWTLAEVALALDAFGDDVRAVKSRFRGATVTAVRPSGISNPPDQQKQAHEAKGAIVAKREAKRQAPPSLPGFSPGRPPPTTGGFDWAKGNDVPF